MNSADAINLFLRSWPVILFLIVIVFHTGATFFVICYHSKSIKELKKDTKELRENDQEISKDAANRITNHLYDKKHQPIYTPMDFCLSCQKKCLQQRTKELDYLANEVRDSKELLKTYMKAIIEIVKRNNTSLVKMIKENGKKE